MDDGIANICDNVGPRVRLAHDGAADFRHAVALGPVHPLRKRGGRKTDGYGGQSEVAEQTGQEQRLSSAGSAASDFWQTAGIGKPLRKRFQNGAEFRIAYITQTLSHVAGHGLQHFGRRTPFRRSEEHTSELQSLMRISYAVFCLKKKKKYK